MDTKYFTAFRTFRGVAEHRGWVYGSLLCVNDATYIYNQRHADFDDIDFGHSFIKVVPETVGVFTGFRTREGLHPIFDGDVIFDRVNNVYNVECRVGGVYVVSGGISMLLSSCADANATVDLTLVETHFL
jgi:hypothetical protein